MHGPGLVRPGPFFQEVYVATFKVWIHWPTMKQVRAMAKRLGSRCERCGGPGPLTGSRFNEEMICLVCDAEERAHPQYEEARRREEAQVQAGNLNYPGIGLPADLQAKADVRRASR